MKQIFFLFFCFILCNLYAQDVEEFSELNETITQLNTSQISDTLSDDRPNESYEKITYYPRTSILHIPIDINVALIEKKLNENFSELLFEDNNIEDDSMMVKAWKTSDFKINYDGNTLTYQIPIKFWIKKRFDIGLTTTDREIEGAIQLDFKTKINLSKNWELITQTTIENYKWTKKPTMKIAFMDLPITYFVDKIIADNGITINNTIDKTLKENVPLKTFAKNIWMSSQDPMDISTDEYKAWIKTTPKQIYCTPITGNQGKISTTIGIKCLMEVYLGQAPTSIKKNDLLPDLTMYAKTDKNYNINIMADVPFYILDSLAENVMIGQTFGEGKKSVVVDSIEIFGQDKKLIVGVDIAGFINGKIYLECIPYYNQEDFTIRVKDVDYKLETKNLLAKIVNLFYKKGMKKKLEEELVFSIKDEYYLIKDLSRSELFNMEITENVKLNGFIKDMNVDNLYITEEGLKISLILMGKLRVSIE